MADLRILIQGRGGQGAQLAGNLLARAFIAEGREADSVATYGRAPGGTAVSATVRVDCKPLRLLGQPERLDALLCFDAGLLDGRLPAAVGPHTLIVVNSTRPPSYFSQELPGFRVFAVDGAGIAQRNGLGGKVKPALLGALACAVGAPALETLAAAIEADGPHYGLEKVAACVEGYRHANVQLLEAAA